MLGAGGGQFFLEHLAQCRQVHLLQQVLQGLGTHAGAERAVAVGVFGLAQFGFGQQLAEFKRGVAGLGDDIILIINDALQLAGTDVQQQADARRHALVKPDMGNRHGQFDVAHALAAHAAEGHFHPAAVANDALVFDALVFAAGALPVTGGSEDALAKQTTFFRLERPVVDGFGIFHFPLGPGPDDFRGGHGDGNLVKGFRAFVNAEEFAKVGVNTHNGSKFVS